MLYNRQICNITSGPKIGGRSGYNLRLVQKQLGHSSPSITQVYADVMNTDVEKALKNLEKGEE